MAELYKVFSKDWEGLDYSDSALIEMFNSESYGTQVNQRTNGFYVGKQWLNVNVAMWKEDQKRGHLVISELYSDERFPPWWLDSIF